MTRRPPLSRMLSDKPWRLRLDPFPHLLTTELFTPSIAEQVSEQARKAVADLAELTPFEHYDARAAGLTPDLPWPLNVFASRQWLDLMGSVLDVPLTPHIAGGVHHHHVGSASGTVHCDYNPVFYPDDEPVDGVIVSRGDVVGYTTGKAKRGVKRVNVVRAIAILYYTGNDEWKPGDGGGTGLYQRGSDPIGAPYDVVQPHNNTLLAFECTPHSYHGFIRNRRIERNAVVAWFHRDLDDIKDRWGEPALERWNAS